MKSHIQDYALAAGQYNCCCGNELRTNHGNKRYVFSKNYHFCAAVGWGGKRIFTVPFV